MKTSIIILSFNHFDETTGTCLKFLAQDPDFPQWEVIVVDNASSEDTRKSLVELSQLFENVTVVLNASNVGFSAGNNIGINKATGDCIVLLNSDAFPPPGMLKKLTAKLEGDNLIGMIGPVTNAAGNEQLIATPEGDMSLKISAGLQFANAGSYSPIPAYRLDFFCVAIPRRVIEKVGLLDESFGRGYFEDLDYSLRVKAAGYQLLVAEDCFIYHRGSSSFKKVPQEVKALLKKNKRIVSAKHGKRVVFQHKRTANLAVLEHYSDLKNAGQTVSEFRIANRFELARKDSPRGPLKRWLYLRRISKLSKRLEGR
jgi:GT2 family glycosyltransferase